MAYINILLLRILLYTNGQFGVGGWGDIYNIEDTQYIFLGSDVYESLGLKGRLKVLSLPSTFLHVIILLCLQ